MIMSLVGRPGNFTAYVGVGPLAALAAHVKDHGDKAWTVKSIADITVPFWCYDATDGSAAAPVTPLILVGRPGNFIGYYNMIRFDAVASHVAAHGAGAWDVRVIEADAPFWCYDAAEVP